MADFVTDRQHGKLYHVQDNDRPLFVIAGSWSGAVSMWKRAIAMENDMSVADVDEPQGVQLVAEEDGWITELNLIQETVEPCLSQHLID